LIGEIERKVVVGIALESAYQDSPESVSRLLSLWEAPGIETMKKVSKDLLESSKPGTRAIGHVLQQGLGGDVPEPDPIAWRDLALDLYSCELNLVSYMGRVAEMLQEEKDSVRKKTLVSIHDAFREWQKGISGAIGSLRRSDWTQAKIEIDNGYLRSGSSTLDSLVTLNPNYRGGIKLLREETKKVREILLGYPSNPPFPLERAATIARLQKPLLALYEIGRTHESDPIVSDAVTYPIEKLGTAVSYLIDGVEIASANYEVGIASDHLKDRVKEIPGSVGRNLKKIADDLEMIFSELPAKPWGVPGFGAPRVESRFEDDDPKTNSP
jgi:hypothetical protein